MKVIDLINELKKYDKNCDVFLPIPTKRLGLVYTNVKIREALYSVMSVKTPVDMKGELVNKPDKNGKACILLGRSL